ncbi:biotin/lipoyl-binding carrier protein [Mesobacillus harenae]|uniref:biotin/lipoyl-binding carrier protein n=1 Tax=Mesobacillus harenae TaxID=2213203 RepID=UPI00157FE1C8|nr:biotin/lipoyl-binding carrier protein [Mesobacillus harenae]
MALTEVTVEITGSIWKIEVSEGVQVEEDDTLIIMESMKMEIPLLSPVSGTVKELKVKEGDSVSEGEVAVIIEG